MASVSKFIHVVSSSSSVLFLCKRHMLCSSALVATPLILSSLLPNLVVHQVHGVWFIAKSNSSRARASHPVAISGYSKRRSLSCSHVLAERESISVSPVGGGAASFLSPTSRTSSSVETGQPG